MKTTKKLTTAEKRVAIAKDALAQIAVKKFVVETGNTYVGVKKLPNGATSGNQLQDELKKIPKCTVCALGACFLSSVRKFNDIKTADVLFSNEFAANTMEADGASVKVHIEKYFSCDQRQMIENAFEGWSYGWPAKTTDTQRLTAILKNIIKNEGTFKPSQL